METKEAVKAALYDVIHEIRVKIVNEMSKPTTDISIVRLETLTDMWSTVNENIKKIDEQS